jgi:hypothetical protein
MGRTVGGSEISALMGLNPYSNFGEVVSSKLAVLTGESSWVGGEACWWGTLFEDVIAAYVADDLGDAVRGDDICVQAVPGHRNSPDGYLVARLYTDAGGAQRLWTTAMDPALATRLVVLLLEFKCPLGRKPSGAVPRQYAPQVWSGLAVSPVAGLGLFVDAVFRKCSLSDLGDTPDYDEVYHRGGRGAWHLPVAWGLIAVYAPYLDAPRSRRLGWQGAEWATGDPDPDAPDADAAQAAWCIHAEYFGLRPEPRTGTRAAAAAPPSLVDLGDMEPRPFGRVLGLIDRKRFPVVRHPACFADGRGAPLHTAGGVGAALTALRRDAPPDHWLLGVLPWKAFEVDYVPLAPRRGFLEEVRPHIDLVHATVASVLAEAEATGEAPRTVLARQLGRPTPEAGASAAVSVENVQDLFDSIAVAPAPEPPP